MSSVLLVDEPAKHVRRLTLNRPEQLNAMTAELCQALHDELSALARERSCRAVLLTGRRVGAAEALQMGLVADIAGEGRLAERALEAAVQIAALAPWGVRLTKRGAWTALEIPSEQAAVEFEDRQQIMSTFGRAVPE